MVVKSLLDEARAGHREPQARRRGTLLETAEQHFRKPRHHGEDGGVAAQQRHRLGQPLRGQDSSAGTARERAGQPPERVRVAQRKRQDDEIVGPAQTRLDIAAALGCEARRGSPHELGRARAARRREHHLTRLILGRAVGNPFRPGARGGAQPPPAPCGHGEPVQLGRRAVVREREHRGTAAGQGREGDHPIGPVRTAQRDEFAGADPHTDHFRHELLNRRRGSGVVATGEPR